MVIRRYTGPNCPNCYCRMSSVVWRGKRLGRELAQRKCGRCATLWYERVAAPPPPVDAVEIGTGDWPEPDPPPSARPAPPAIDAAAAGVAYGRTCCPACGSRATSVRSTRRAKTRDGVSIRWHKCKDCGRSFKSTEPAAG